MFRDDLSLIHGNHIFQFGGSYQRNFDKHQRDDNGVNILSSIVYQINSGSGIAMPSAYIPSTVPANQVCTWNTMYASVLGLVSQPQVFYARSGGNTAARSEFDFFAERHPFLQPLFQRYLAHQARTSL